MNTPTASKPIVHDRNGDPVFVDTPLHAKGAKTPTVQIREDYFGHVMVTDLHGNDFVFYSPGGMVIPVRIHKDQFCSTWWQVKSYA